MNKLSVITILAVLLIVPSSYIGNVYIDYKVRNTAKVCEPSELTEKIESTTKDFIFAKSEFYKEYPRNSEAQTKLAELTVLDLFNEEFKVSMSSESLDNLKPLNVGESVEDLSYSILNSDYEVNAIYTNEYGVKILLNILLTKDFKVEKYSEVAYN